MDQKASAKVLVLDLGAQYGQLIARRVRDLNVYSEIVPCDISADEIREMNASALILSRSGFRVCRGRSVYRSRHL